MDLAALRCLRWDEEGEARLARLTPVEWRELTALMSRKAGLPLLSRRLRRSSVVPPPEVAQVLRHSLLACASQNLKRRAALAQVIGEVGRPALLLKGIDLMDRLYANLGHRSMGDVDIAVSHNDIAIYDAHLLRKGFSVSAQPTVELMGDPYHHHAIYRRNRDKLLVELHWRLGDAAYDEVENVLARAIPSLNVAPQAFVMAPTDLFLYLCSHMADHLFDTPLVHLWDIAELASGSPIAVDWPAALEAAERNRLTKAARLALYLTSETLGVSVEHICDWKPDPTLAAMLPNTLTNLGLFPRADGVVGYRIAVLLGKHNSWRERITALYEAVLPSRKVVRSWFGKPDDGIWGDCRSYLRRWRHLLKSKVRVFAGWAVGSLGVVSHLDSASALRRYLKSD